MAGRRLNQPTRVQKYTAAQRKQTGGASAVRVHQPPAGSRPAPADGAARPVFVVTSAQLKANGGTVELLDNEPMLVVVGAPGSGLVESGPAIPVYPVDANGNFDATF